MSNIDYVSLVAKAIQSDDKGLGFFTTEQGLSDFLVAMLHCSEADANRTARHMLNEDRRGNRYYYLPEGGSEKTLADLLKGIAPK